MMFVFNKFKNEIKSKLDIDDFKIKIVLFGFYKLEKYFFIKIIRIN